MLSCLLSSGSSAQSCEGYYLLQQGKTITMTNYGRKDKVTGSVVYTISKVTAAKGGVTATVHTQVKNEQNENVSSSETNVDCNGGVYHADIRMMLNQQQQKHLEKYKVQTNFFVDYPTAMKVGDVLKDARFIVEANSEDALSTDMTISIEERTVLANEQITTDAGTWDCFRIKARITLKATVGGIDIPFSSDYLEWFAPGFGIVKTEMKSYRSELTSIK